MSCVYVSARLRVCSSRALSCLRALFCVGACVSDPGVSVDVAYFVRIAYRKLSFIAGSVNLAYFVKTAYQCL